MLYFAELFNWSSKITEAIPGHIEEPHKDRKEKICRRAIDYFAQGKFWEKGITLLKVLEKKYRIAYQYEKLPDILDLQAKFYREIITKERFPHEYFLVEFCGSAFPKTISVSYYIRCWC
jgi:dedicator of cytokinesis protein 3